MFGVHLSKDCLEACGETLPDYPRIHYNYFFLNCADEINRRAVFFPLQPAANFELKCFIMREADTFIAIHRRRPMHRIIEIISIDVSDRTGRKIAFLPDKITFVGFFESFFAMIHFIPYRTVENEGI